MVYITSSNTYVNSDNSIPTVLCEYNRLTLYLIALGDFNCGQRTILVFSKFIQCGAVSVLDPVVSKLYLKKLSTFAEFEFSAIIVTYYVYVSIYILYTS